MRILFFFFIVIFIMKALCMICFQPNEIWCGFLNEFSNYHVFIIIDSLDYDCSDLKKKYTNLSFIQIENSKCKSSGYINTSYITREIMGWDKALYYFSIENKQYDFVWFLEDDVFFNNENTILKIDEQFNEDDLLSNQCSENSYEKRDEWYHWGRFHVDYPLPWYRGMMCAVRLSKKILNCIDEYANQHGTLFYLEALFPTICMKNNLLHSCPKEMEEIHWAKNFEKENIMNTHIYHPVKDLQNHLLFRETESK